MPLVPAKCPECGGNIQVDPTKKAAVCDCCGTAFIVEEAIKNYNITNIHIHQGEDADRLFENIKGLIKRKNDKAAEEAIVQFESKYPADCRVDEAKILYVLAHEVILTDGGRISLNGSPLSGDYLDLCALLALLKEENEEAFEEYYQISINKVNDVLSKKCGCKLSGGLLYLKVRYFGAVKTLKELAARVKGYQGIQTYGGYSYDYGLGVKGYMPADTYDDLYSVSGAYSDFVNTVHYKDMLGTALCDKDRYDDEFAAKLADEAYMFIDDEIYEEKLVRISARDGSISRTFFKDLYNTFLSLMTQEGRDRYLEQAEKEEREAEIQELKEAYAKAKQEHDFYIAFNDLVAKKDWVASYELWEKSKSKGFYFTEDFKIKCKRGQGIIYIFKNKKKLKESEYEVAKRKREMDKALKRLTELGVKP